jgi:hypothetical protein
MDFLESIITSVLIGYGAGFALAFLAYGAWLAITSLLANNGLPLPVLRCRALRWLTRGEWLVLRYADGTSDVVESKNDIVITRYGMAVLG